MKKLLVIILLLINFKVLSQSSDVVWNDFQEKFKEIHLLGKIDNKIYLVYINKEKKIILRKYNNNLSSFSDLEINYILKNRTNFYQKSLIINNKITHFIAEINAEKKIIELFAYVQDNPDSSQLVKYLLAENALNKGAKLWALNLEFFANFDIELSDDKSKIYAQATDYDTEILFSMGSKKINAFECSDLSKKIKSYNYYPDRTYLRKNKIQISNTGDIIHSDYYRTTTDKKNIISSKHFLIRKPANDSLEKKSLKLFSEVENYESLYQLLDNKDLYTFGFKEVFSDTRTSKFYLYKHNINNLVINDSINIDVSNFYKTENENKGLPYHIHSAYKNSKNQLIIIAQQFHFIRSVYVNTHSSFNYKDFVIFTYDLNTNKIELNNFTSYDDKFELISREDFYKYSPIITFFKNDELIVLYRENKTNLIKTIKLDNLKKISTKILVNEREENANIPYGKSILIDSDKLLMIDYKKDKVGLINL